MNVTLGGVTFWIVAIVATILILGALVLIHELGHFVTARLAGIRVLEFGIGFPPRAKVLAVRGETEYTLNWLPIGGFVKLEGEDAESDDPRAFGNAPLSRQLIVLVAGVAMNLLLAFVLFFFIAWLANPTAKATITEVVPNSPAAGVGLAKGDAIETINGQSFAILPSLGDPRQQIIDDLRSHAGQRVSLGIVDGSGNHRQLDVLLRTPKPGEGALGVGLESAVSYASSNPGSALVVGAQSAGRALGVILDGLGVVGRQLVSNPTQGPKDIQGPVGITQTLGSVVEQLGIVYVLLVAGILSANLALINVLPFPPLDGGRMAVLVVKRIAGKRGVSALEATSYLVGFALLLAFIAWISFFDIANLLKGS